MLALIIIYLISGFLLLIFSGYVSSQLFQHSNYKTFIYGLDYIKRDWKKMYTVLFIAIVIFGGSSLIASIFGGYKLNFMRNCSSVSGPKCETMSAEYWNSNIFFDITSLES